MAVKNQKKQQPPRKLTWEEVLKLSPHAKVEILKNQYPKELQYLAGKVLEQSGFEDNDLLFWDVLLEAKMAHKSKEYEDNMARIYTWQTKSVEVLEALRGQQLDFVQNLKAHEKLKKQELAQAKAMITQNKAPPKKPSTKPSNKEQWIAWLQSPGGTIQTAILIGIFILIFK